MKIELKKFLQRRLSIPAIKERNRIDGYIAFEREEIAAS